MCGPATVPTILAFTPKWLSASISWAAIFSWPAVSGLALSPWENLSRPGSGSFHGKSGWSVTWARSRFCGVGWAQRRRAAVDRRRGRGDVALQAAHHAGDGRAGQQQGGGDEEEDRDDVGAGHAEQRRGQPQLGLAQAATPGLEPGLVPEAV